MSIAIHMNGRTRGEMKAGIRLHQLRQNEQEGKDAQKHTDSAINPELSKYNLVVADDPERFGAMRHKVDAISDAKVRDGKKRLYKNTNVLLVGTVQISDDSLEALGWQFDKDGKKLPVDQQPEQAVKNVKAVYLEAFRSIKAQPERYGEIFSATMHFDETSPHMDFMCDPLDVATQRTANYYLDGGKGVKKGQKLAEMQDHLMDKSKLSQETIDRFQLVRGDTAAAKGDRADKLRKTEKALNARETALDARQSDLNALDAQLRQKGNNLLKTQNTLSERARTLDERTKALDNRETALDTRETALDARQSDLNALDAQLRNQRAKLLKTQNTLSDRATALDERAKALDNRETALDARDKHQKTTQIDIKRQQQDLTKRENKAIMVDKSLRHKHKEILASTERLEHIKADNQQVLDGVTSATTALRELMDKGLRLTASQKRDLHDRLERHKPVTPTTAPALAQDIREFMDGLDSLGQDKGGLSL